MDGFITKLIVLILALFTGIILILTTEDIQWISDEIMAIIVSIIFISPVVTSLFYMRPPKEYILVFFIGGILFAGYSFLMFSCFHDFIGFLLKVILFSAISSLAYLVVKKLEEVVPP